MFVGKTRSGKSTALDTLKTPWNFVTQSSIFSETADAKISYFTVEVGEKEKFNFNINIIDTPGLFEVSDNGKARDNEVLEDLVLKCMNAEITKIHAIYFVISYTGCINPQDIEALARFIKLFNGAQEYVSILITKCENLDEGGKAKVRDELLKYPIMAELLGNTSKNILFIGAVEHNIVDKGSIDAFKAHLDSVITMREDFFENVFEKEDSFSLNTLKIVDKVKQQAEELFKNLKEELVFKDSIIDIQAFKNGCKKLGGWLPLLSTSDYEAANLFLLESEEFMKGK